MNATPMVAVEEGCVVNAIFDPFMVVPVALPISILPVVVLAEAVLVCIV